MKPNIMDGRVLRHRYVRGLWQFQRVLYAVKGGICTTTPCSEQGSRLGWKNSIHVEEEEEEGKVREIDVSLTACS